jgi:hypothetical protein
MASASQIMASVSFLDTLAEIACQTVPVEPLSSEKSFPKISYQVRRFVTTLTLM